MIKTLTEQWREGTLPRGSYYIRIITGIEKSDFFEGKKFCFWTDYEVEEVLAPVPSYNEYKRLQEQIKEANTVICGLYHLTTDKKEASGVVCDYLVKYGKPFEVESGV